MTEKAYEKHAWILFLVVGFVVLSVGSMDMILGASPDPAPQFTAPGPFVRATGVVLAALGVLIISMAGVPYRNGERWAWYALWLVPLFLLGLVLLQLSAGGSVWPIQLTIMVIAVLGLLLPYRKFFPRRPGAEGAPEG